MPTDDRPPRHPAAHAARAVAREILSAILHAACYALFFAFLCACAVVCPPVYLACLALGWAADRIADLRDAAGRRDGPRGRWKFEDYDLGGRE